MWFIVFIAPAHGRGDNRDMIDASRYPRLSRIDRPADLQAATEHWYRVTSPVQPLPGLHSYAGFGHLTGYGACYYTYQWSLVIARDLLSGFGGDLLNAEAAERYRREILEPGGSRDAADLVERFLGRPFAFDAYREWLAGA